MTPKEIAKALRCCGYWHESASDCKGCPCYRTEDCSNSLDKQAAELIEAQVKLIDVLQKKCNERKVYLVIAYNKFGSDVVAAYSSEEDAISTVECRRKTAGIGEIYTIVKTPVDRE